MEQRRIGRYQILEEIASGGQGTVSRAFDPQTNQIVAVKVLLPNLTSDSSYLERFHREARIAASIHHPNVVRIFEVGEDDGLQFIAMEFLPENLARVIESSGALSIEGAVRFAVQTAEGLAATHAHGVVHRDVKPQNVLISQDGTAKVTDFGIARAETLSTLTATGVMMGTPHYMSPEQARGEQAGYQSDIYSLGCLLFQMLSGEVPFQGTTPLAVIRQHIDEKPRSIRDLRREVPRELAMVVERSMEKDPGRRFESMTLMAEALRSAVPGAVQTMPARSRPASATRAHTTPQEPPTSTPRIQNAETAGTKRQGLRRFVYGAASAVAISAVVGGFMAISGIGFGGSGPENTSVAPTASTTPAAPSATGQSKPTSAGSAPITAPALDDVKFPTPSLTVSPAPTFARAPDSVESKLPPQNAASGIYLASLTPVRSSVGAYTISVGRYTFTGYRDPVSIGDPIVGWGKTYPNGIYAHAPSIFTYELKDEFQLLKATIFLWEVVSCGNGAIFRVLLDDVEAYVSPVMPPSMEPQNIEIDISGATRVTLITDTGESQDNDCDWAIWGDPILLKNEAVGVDEQSSTPDAVIPTPTSLPAPTADPLAIYSQRRMLSNAEEDIWLQYFDGTPTQRLIDTATYEDMAAWSPDGEKIVYHRAASRDLEADIWVMNRDGTGQTQVTFTGPSEDSAQPDWSADGQFIVFYEGGGISEVGSDGSGFRKIVLSSPTAKSFPVISPDQTRIAFAETLPGWQGPSPYTPTIVVINRDGTGRTVVHIGPQREDVDRYQVFWSPDGTKLAFREFDGGKYLVDADGESPAEITLESTITWEPSHWPRWFGADDLVGPLAESSDASQASTQTPLVAANTPGYVEGAVLFEDDFEAGFARSLNLPNTFSVVRDEDGNFVLQAAAGLSELSSISIGEVSWGDYAFEYRFKALDNSAEAGLFASIRVGSSGDVYLVRFSSEGSELRREFNTIDPRFSAFLASSDDIKLTENTWYTLRIEAAGPHLSLSINGQEVLSFEDPEPLLKGQIDLDSPSGVVLHFDDIRVVELLPTQATAGPSPAPSPAPSPSVAANTPGYVEGEVLFEDNFEAGFARGWNRLDGDFSIVRDGVDYLVLEANSSERVVAIAGDDSWEDYALDFKFRVEESKIDSGWDFVVRDHLGEIGCEGYDVRVGPSSEGVVRIYKGGDVGCQEAVLDRINLLSLSPQTWYSIRSEAAGNNISVYLDGQLILSGEDNSAPLLDGAIRFSVDPGVHIQFDDVRVVELLSTEATTDPSPTASPVPSPSVAANTPGYVEGDVLFEDDFEAGYASNWEFVSPGFDVIQDADGDWVLRGEGPEWENAHAGTPLWGDYAVEANVKVLQESELHGSVSINIHDLDQNNCIYARYEISLNLQGADVDREGDTEDDCDFFTLEKNNTFGLDLDRWYLVRIESMGAAIVVFVDGVPILSGEDTSDSPLLKGPIRLMNAPGSIVYYDDVRVVELLPQ